MASLYKKPVHVRDPKTGEHVLGRSRKWWGRYRAADGREKRVPLAIDKSAAQAMLNELVRRVERERAGIADPYERHRARPLAEHITEWRGYLEAKGNSTRHVTEVVFKVRRIVERCGWRTLQDISPSDVVQCLASLRNADGLSIQTSNHYLRGIKQFSRWLVRERRTNEDRLLHLSGQNPQVDRRHRRRALVPEEFSRLVRAARGAGPIESISGPDRAMLYVLAAWTGFRKGEIGSLTPESFRLDAEPPTATVSASYSKRRREDTQVLHPEVARQLREWLAAKRPRPGGLLFPVSRAVPGGIERKTHKMMERDLWAARSLWLAESADAAERARREQSDFLVYENQAGEFADFHSNRHLFITSLERAGLSPKMAQTLARHSDIRLTLGVYTHVGVLDQTAAIQTLPGPPGEG